VTAPVDQSQFKFSKIKIERDERRPVNMPGHAALEDGQTAQILVLDLSYEGCGLQIPVPLAVGQTITLSVLKRGAIKAEVRWYANGKAGVVFKPEVSPAEQQHRARKSRRVALDAEVLMRRLGRAKYRLRMFDISPEGCKVELVERPTIGEHLFIKFEGLEVLEAEVCWVEKSCAGLRFQNAIHPAVFDLILQRIS
jgi:hypothetical protein